MDLDQEEWLTCPMTENGAIRVLGRAQYGNPELTLSDIAHTLRELRSVGRHRFIGDDVTLLDEVVFNVESLRSPNQITDTYLLALAAHHDAALATFDRRIVKDAVRLPNASIHFIGQETSPV
jgi:predicted nucleic acid-binding protein